MITFLVINAILLTTALILLLAERYLVTYGECSVVINGEKVYKVLGGDNLLTYLNQNRLFIPSACGGKATCGFCKIKVLGGAGKILPTEEVYIDRDERKEGMRLACLVKVKQNVEIYIPEYMLGAEEFELEVLDIEDSTHDIKLINLRILNSKEINFKPGQYMQFKIPGTDEYRAYSIASPTSVKDRIELIIRLVPGGLCSTYAHKALEKADRVTFTGPFGDFFLREDSGRDIIAIGGGCGMAPIRSIIYRLIDEGMPRRLFYFFGARTKKDLFFTEELKDIEKRFPNFRYIPALSEPLRQDRWNGEVGLITQVAEKYIDPAGKHEAYLCGPPPMIDAAIKLLARKGVGLEDIYYDKF
jgi:Na+-transporting NADH:ubiquinone oxidoreductase subunit F